MGRSQIWLSLLIPVYNVGPYLEACLDSILTQIDGDGVEIILVDDASTDASRTLCERFAATHQDLIRALSHPENRGVSAARNTLLDVARGDYVWFIDPDDMLLPGAIEALRAVVAEAAPDMILCDYAKHDRPLIRAFAGPARRIERDRAALVRGVFAKRQLHLWTKISRRRLWGDDIRFPAGRCFEDIATIPWILLRAESYYYVDEPWLFYRTRADSIMARLGRSARSFDNRRNDDLAQALIGYPESLAAALPDAPANVSQAVAQFCAREFVKIGKRLVRTQLGKAGWARSTAELRQYRHLVEQGSPLDFTAVAQCYIREGRLFRWAMLRLFLAASGRHGPA